MNRALLYLLAVRLKNTLLGSVRRPARLVGLLLLLGAFVLMIALRKHAADAGGGDLVVRQTLLTAVLALYLLLAVLGGMGEPGLGLLPADLDYVLPGPFRRREILVYHLARQYGQILVLALMYVVFLGAAALPRPGFAYLATVLCLGMAAHLQAAATLAAAQVGDRVFGRLRRSSRLALLLVLLVAAVLALVGIAGSSDVGGLLGRVLASRPAQVLLYPAIAAGRVAGATTLATAMLPLVGLVACVVGSFLLVLAFPFDVVETTAVTAAERRKRLADGTTAGVRTGRPGRHLPGAAALTWLNAVVLRRRLRVVGGLAAMLIVIMLVSSARGESGAGSLPGLIGVLAFFPVIANVPLGFRGHREHLELLKTLPLAPRRLALAEIAVPVLLIYAAQLAAVLAFALMGRLEVRWVLGAVIALPILDLGIVALVETFQLGRDPRQAGFLWTALQMLAIVATLAPALVVGILLGEATGREEVALLGAAAVHVVVVLGLVTALGRRFQRWEPGGDA